MPFSVTGHVLHVRCIGTKLIRGLDIRYSTYLRCEGPTDEASCKGHCQWYHWLGSNVSLAIVLAVDLYTDTRHSGSTATIIRLPYTNTLKPYKGDFLYRTTDFAIWTTVEVGVGITAGCIATLKPLFKAALGSTGQNSAMPWTKTPKGGFVSKTGGSYGTQQALDDLRPAGERNIRTTTVTGGRGSSSDEENMLDTPAAEEHWDGIRKGVTTTVVTEVASQKSPYGDLRPGQSRTTADKRRSFSVGQTSSSTLDEEERRKPVGTFNPFQ